MPTVSYPGGPRLDVATDFVDKELIRQVPGARYDGERKLWTVPRSWAACLQLRGLFGSRLVIDASVNEWAFAEKQRVEQATHLRDRLELDADDVSREAEVIRSWRS